MRDDISFFSPPKIRCCLIVSRQIGFLFIILLHCNYMYIQLFFEKYSLIALYLSSLQPKNRFSMQPCEKTSALLSREVNKRHFCILIL